MKPHAHPPVSPHAATTDVDVMAYGPRHHAPHATPAAATKSLNSAHEHPELVTFADPAVDGPRAHPPHPPKTQTPTSPHFNADHHISGPRHLPPAHGSVAPHAPATEVDVMAYGPRHHPPHATPAAATRSLHSAHEHPELVTFADPAVDGPRAHPPRQPRPTSPQPTHFNDDHHIPGPRGLPPQHKDAAPHGPATDVDVMAYGPRHHAPHATPAAASKSLHSAHEHPELVSFANPAVDGPRAHPPHTHSPTVHYNADHHIPGPRGLPPHEHANVPHGIANIVVDVDVSHSGPRHLPAHAHSPVTHENERFADPAVDGPRAHAPHH
ncbi:hypothetical protein HDV05_000929 [Chytridiales sp. JEL 0842]|nr:hypothetical protein HDV05_000929 [Chytridiales sp. JEL 0842]